MDSNISTGNAGPSPRRQPGLFVGDGEMGRLIHDTDWSATALGPAELWPESLKSILGIVVTCQYPMAIYWGPEGYLLYNDAWRPIVGNKHPWALGRAGAEVWSEIWDVVGPVFEDVHRTGKGIRQNDQQLAMHRFGYTEECYFDYTFSPIYGADGAVDGILNVASETTYRVLNERRMRLVREVTYRTLKAKSREESCSLAFEALRTGSFDVPFALLYLKDDTSPIFRLGAHCGIEAGSDIGPPTLDAAADSPWSFGQLIRSPRPLRVDGLEKRFENLRGRPWPEPVKTAVVQPLHRNESVMGFLILGICPRRELDSAYSAFLDSLSRSVETAINQADAYEKERERAEALAELDRAKTKFFSNVSHEFRTPLTLMLGPIEDSLRDGEDRLSDKQRARQELVHRNSLRLLKLVNSLLDFARIEAGRFQAVFEPIGLGDLTRDLASVFRSAVEAAGLKLIVNVPDLAEPVYVDRDMWEKIVLNLLSNALKFTFEGEIEISLESDDEKASLRIRDTGTGISREEQGNLFKRFHRIEGAKSRSHEGTGIGLALIQELVRLHGGSISVESEAGKGSTFRIDIPLGSAHLPAEQLGKRRQSAATEARASAYIEEAMGWLPRQGESPRGALDERLGASALDVLPGIEPGSATVFLADDNADMRGYVQSLLSPNWNVEAFANGRELLSALDRRQPDLIVSDAMMPELDGFGLLKAVRSRASAKAIPFILLSARAGEDAVIEGIQAGADDYVVKPFSAKELLVRIKAQLDLARVRAQATEALEKRATELARSNAELAQFAYVASHDLKEPLRIVRTHLQFVQRLLGGKLEPKPAEHMQFAMDASGRMYELINDLLEYARVGVSRDKATAVSAAEAMTGVLDSLATSIHEAGAVVETGKLPVVHAVPGQIRQLFQNLVDNSLKYREPARPLRVSVSAETFDTFAVFSVKDNGIGFDPQYSTKIFELFQRLHHRGDRPGTGIGLSICKKIVEQHGGRIWAESIPDQGSVFKFTLPIEPAEGTA